jgi:transposase InsO family protein
VNAIPDLVERNFPATAPDQLWVADITYVVTWNGFVYVVVHLVSGRKRLLHQRFAHRHLRRSPSSWPTFWRSSPHPVQVNVPGEGIA